MIPLIEQLISQGPVVLDGAWGTQLQKMGLSLNGCPEAWNLDRQDAVTSVAQSYVDAGAQIILTNSFGANRVRLANHGLETQLVEINLAAAQASRRVASNGILVFGSIGPTGLTKADEIVHEQAQALKTGGVDGLVIETMCDLTEATTAITAAKRTGLPTAATLVFFTDRNQRLTANGVTPEQAAIELSAAGADIVGANCITEVAAASEICERMRSATETPIWIKANAGIPVIQDDRAIYQLSVPEFALQANQLVEAGAHFVGGCCGTTPEMIRAFADSRA